MDTFHGNDPVAANAGEADIVTANASKNALTIFLNFTSSPKMLALRRP